MDEKERELKFRKEIAVAIKQERRYFGYSTKTVSAFLGMDWRKYSQIEKAEEPISVVELDKLANLYGLDMQYFMDVEYRKKIRKGRKRIRWCKCGYDNPNSREE